MLLTRLHELITTPTAKTSRGQMIFWFCLSLTFALIYAWLGLRKAFDGEYVVQDDARQHVFWMVRFLDPQLFPNDLIADYFQSVAPAGYTSIYRLAAAAGINPLFFNKLLPPVLGLIVTGYCFGLCLEIFPIPAAGFVATLLFNQQMGFKDDIISATPRAFAYPLLLAFLYYLLRGKLWQTLGAIALLGLFYPQVLLLCALILVLRLLDWENGKLGFSQRRSDYIFCAAGLGVTFLILLPFALNTSEYGPAITVAEAKTLPEFWPTGRSSFFNENLAKFFIVGGRSGMFPKAILTPVTLCVGLLLPLLLAFSRRFPLVKQLGSGIKILPQMLLASIALFSAAHALLFKLHLPSRYTGYSLRVIIVLASAIAFTTILDALLKWAQQGTFPRKIIAWVTVAIVSISLLCYPSFVKSFPRNSYKHGKLPELYQFFSQQPKDILIASVAGEADLLPSFTQRSVLVAREYAIPYQLGYYRQFRQRLLDLVRAQYSPDLAEVQKFIQTYGVDFILLDPGALTPEYISSRRQRWIIEMQPAQAAIDNMKQGKTPALAKVINSCQAFQTQGMVVLDANCILNQS
ncbi:MAG: hypothetical protein EBE86_034070 [Hormoscilla sp. GUM202]|nr:hypothetical protein [Hormoscilla sp. GUM202]